MESSPELKPLLITLPKDGKEYFPVLQRGQTVGMRSGLVTLAPGEEVGEHTTGDHEESVIIIEGNGEAVIDGRKRLKVCEGQLVYNPPHTRHNLVNTSDATFRYIYVVSQVHV